jgi:N-acylglucosamine-6-phosphate 2-epimerase
VGTTLFGYTAQTKNFSPPGWELLTQIIENLNTFVICEGGVSSPEMAKKALDLGANAVVVGGAITGIDLLVKAYISTLEN